MKVTVWISLMSWVLAPAGRSTIRLLFKELPGPYLSQHVRSQVDFLSHKSNLWQMEGIASMRLVSSELENGSELVLERGD